MDSLATSTLETLAYPKLNNFYLFNLCITSSELRTNPLGDPFVRNNPVLSPKKISKKPPGLVFVLSGFAGNGTKYLGDKGFEETFLQQLDRLMGQGRTPYAHYILVDAWTFWGGSQFLNSLGTGNYENYIIRELYPTVRRQFEISSSDHTAVVGYSSGGYGALHLASKYPKFFPFCGALSPDCFFEASLKPDLYKAAPFLAKYSNYAELMTFHHQKKIFKKQNGFSILNVIAMAACYSPAKTKNQPIWPIDFKTGKMILPIWRQWKLKDPVEFLKKRFNKLQTIKGFYLEVGTNDEFNLQLGVRQIHAYLKKHRFSHHYEEFEGGHFDSNQRYPIFWEWLKIKWREGDGSRHK